MRARYLALLLMAAVAAGCGPTVDLRQGIEMVDVSTGLADLGIINGQNKLVPSISFKLKNLSDQKLIALQVNAVFHKVTDPKNEWGSGYVIVAQSEGLAPGATSKEFTIRSPLGYTGLQPRADMLTHDQFIDSTVDLAAKYASAQWVRIAEYPIERKLIAQ
ncbi:MAG TPA: hypothetical protein VJP86_02150 [Vicinamibacterales bacterium]|jgi:hypothetical protein|nr:hypothetical protein [Vicinamibacterales bacterium]